MTTAPVIFQFMPPLLPSEYASLTESIRQHGIQVPVLVDENGAIIDGHHRDMIAAELGIDCPRDVREGLSDSVKRTLAISLNKDRRHLTRAQVQALLEESVKADPQLSDREHARRIGVSHVTVAAVRTDLESGGQIDHLEYRENPQGRPQPATKPERIDPATGEVLTQPKETKETPVTTVSRLAMPQPPKYGGNRLKHNRIIENVVIAGKGLCIVLDEITELDQTITNEEAERLASDLPQIIRSLKRIQTLLNRKATS